MFKFLTIILLTVLLSSCTANVKNCKLDTGVTVDSVDGTKERSKTTRHFGNDIFLRFTPNGYFTCPF